MAIAAKLIDASAASLLVVDMHLLPLRIIVEVPATVAAKLLGCAQAERSGTPSRRGGPARSGSAGPAGIGRMLVEAWALRQHGKRGRRRNAAGWRCAQPHAASAALSRATTRPNSSSAARQGLPNRKPCT